MANATVDYEVRGEGAPVLLLHGWTMNRRLEIDHYEPIFTGPIFAGRNGFKRIYPDLPGMGRSIAGPGLQNQDDMLAALLGFVDRVLGSERFLLCGTSLGSYLARAIAVERRAQVRGLLLKVPAVIPDIAKRTLPQVGPLPETAAWLAKQRDLVQPAIDATAPFIAEMRNDPKRYGFSFDLEAREKGFSAPALIVAARQDTTVGYRDAWGILESYPRASFAAVDQADHGWPVEPGSARLLQALVMDWLERVARFEGIR